MYPSDVLVSGDGSARRVELPVPAGADVVALWNAAVGAPRAALVLAPGSGETLADPVLDAVARAAARAGVLTVRFEYRHTTAGRRTPDTYAQLQATLRGVLGHAQQAVPGRPLYAGGKSMGARLTTLAAAQGAALAGLVLLGYAVHATGRPQRLRTEHWAALRCPMLLINGTRDPLCVPAALQAALRGTTAPAAVHWMDQADHGLNVPGDPLRTAAAHAQIGALVAAWC